MADNFLYGAARQGLRNARADIRVYVNKIDELREIRRVETAHLNRLKARVAELEERIRGLEAGRDSRDAHLEAEKSRFDYVMGELDRISGGADKNPARRPYYQDVDAFRIPSGVRKGQVVTKADYAYLKGFKDTFEARFKAAWKGVYDNWKEILHPRISY